MPLIPWTFFGRDAATDIALKLGRRCCQGFEKKLALRSRNEALGAGLRKEGDMSMQSEGLYGFLKLHKASSYLHTTANRNKGVIQKATE